MQEHSNSKPITQQRDLTKLPRALAPLIMKPQWAVWRWKQQANGRWQKPPYQALDPQRHASTEDPNTWSDYATALATVQAGDADGVTFIMTAADPFAAIDLDHCRDPNTHSIDIWAQNFLDVARHTYSEVTPSGAGCRIWGLTAADTEPVNRKFTLEIDGKPVAAELFRRTPKALTVTGYKLDSIRELGDLDRAFKWAITWGERRKAAAAEAVEAATRIDGHSFGDSSYSVDLIERIVREGADVIGGNRSDTFHVIVGHYRGCGWSREQIDDHLRQFPNGIADKYLGEGRLAREIDRSARKHAERALPLLDGWQAPETIIEARGQDSPEPASPAPGIPDPANDDRQAPEIVVDDELEPASSPAAEIPDADEDLDDLDELEDPDELEEKPSQNPKLPPLYAHGDPDSRPLKPWLIKHLMPAVGHGLLSGQWGAGKTFVLFDLAAALWSGQPFLGHAVKRQCGVLLIAAEGAAEVRLRLDAVVRHKCGNLQRAPFRWYEITPLLLQKGAVETLIAMARQADDLLQAEFGLPLGLVVIDTIAACAGYTRSGDENDPAAAQAVMNVLKAIAQALDCFTLGVDHFGKDVNAGTRGASSKESAADVVLSCLGDKALSGSVSNTRLAVRKHRGGKQGQQYAFTLREVAAPEPDEDGEPITTMVVDWMPAGAPDGAAGPGVDPWAQSRRQDQRTAVLRLKRVLMEILADQGVDLPIPPDGPMVRMIDQEVVREEFYRHTPVEDGGSPRRKRQLQALQFKRALGWTEDEQLIGIEEIGGVTYLRLNRPREEEVE